MLITLLIVGRFKNGLRHGHGVFYENNRARKYDGAWALSMKEGIGTETFGNGDTYHGEYSRDKFDGQGELITKGGKYKGCFKEGLKHGLGTMSFKNGCRFEGNWQGGRMHGKGFYVWQGEKRH